MGLVNLRIDCRDLWQCRAEPVPAVSDRKEAAKKALTLSLV